MSGSLVIDSEIDFIKKLQEVISKKNDVLAFDSKDIMSSLRFQRNDIDFVEPSVLPVGVPYERIGGECFAPLQRIYLLCAGPREKYEITKEILH